MVITRIKIGARGKISYMSPEVRAEEVGLGLAIAEFCQRPDVEAVSQPDGSVEIVPSPTPQVGGAVAYHFGFPIRCRQD